MPVVFFLGVIFILVSFSFCEVFFIYEVVFIFGLVLYFEVVQNVDPAEMYDFWPIRELEEEEKIYFRKNRVKMISSITLTYE